MAGSAGLLHWETEGALGLAENPPDTRSREGLPGWFPARSPHAMPPESSELDHPRYTPPSLRNPEPPAFWNYIPTTKYFGRLITIRLDHRRKVTGLFCLSHRVLRPPLWCRILIRLGLSSPQCVGAPHFDFPEQPISLAR